MTGIQEGKSGSDLLISIPNTSPTAKHIKTRTVDIMTSCFNTAVKSREMALLD